MGILYDMTKLNDFKVTKRILHNLDNTTEIFFRDMERLNIERPEIIAKATVLQMESPCHN